MPREASRSLALPDGSLPFGNSLNLSGTIYLLNGDLNASAQLTGAVGRISGHDVHKALSPMLGTCKWQVDGSHPGSQEEDQGEEEGRRRTRTGDTRYLLQLASVSGLPTQLR